MKQPLHPSTGKFFWVVAAVLLLAVRPASAQVALEAVAFIENPTGVHYVFQTNPGRPGTGIFTYVNTNSGDFDIVGVTISANQTFQGSSTVTARTVTGQISSASVSLSFNGVTRSGNKEPTFGATTILGGQYYGNFTDPNAGTGALQGIVSASGKFLLFSFLGSNTVLGIGTINSNGDYFVRFTSGLTGSGNFAPVSGIANGNISLSSGVTQSYFVAKAVPAKLANISTRGFVGSGSQVLIGGFIVTEGSKGVIITAKGPSLTAQGVPNALQNPKLEVFLGNQLIASNNDWASNANVAEIAASGLAPTDGREAALFINLLPGRIRYRFRAKTPRPALESWKSLALAGRLAADDGLRPAG
ncbi:MAG: hypothetical protein ACR2NX_13010 [Chthoniobacterales bacterium]